jgi:hypothetical protein
LVDRKIPGTCLAPPGDRAPVPQRQARALQRFSSVATGQTEANVIRTLVVAGALAGMTLFGVGPAHAAEPLQVVKQGNVSYVSGGIGDQSQSRMSSLARDFNLELTLADRQGDYLGGADVAVHDASGRSVLHTESQGPLFLARLTPGKYTVTVSEAGHEQKRSVAVPQHGRAAIVFSMADGARSASR